MDTVKTRKFKWKPRILLQVYGTAKERFAKTLEMGEEFRSENNKVECECK